MNNIEVFELRKLEKLMIKTSMRKMDIKYKKKCKKLNLILDFPKFKPPNLNVYENGHKYYRKVLLKKLE